MGKGRSYENQLVNNINTDDGTVEAWPLGFSGSQATIDADILLTTARDNYLVEAKTASTAYCVVDTEQLERLVSGENPYTSAVLNVKYSNRRSVTVQFYESLTGEDDYDDLSVTEKFAFLTPDCFDPRVRDSGALALTKPSLDDWHSAQASGEPYACLLSDLGLPNEYSEEIDNPLTLLDHE